MAQLPLDLAVDRRASRGPPRYVGAKHKPDDLSTGQDFTGENVRRDFGRFAGCHYGPCVDCHCTERGPGCRDVDIRLPGFL
jgi:hypothetical protein